MCQTPSDLNRPRVSWMTTAYPREAAASALAMYSGEEVVQRLIPLLDDPKAMIAEEVSYRLTHQRDKVMLGRLLTAAARLNPLCLKLAPLAVFFLVLYSYCKRFTALAHVVLGVCLAAAPIGAWIAIRGSIDPPALILGGIVLFWVAGFDILYALQDLEFDRTAGLHSIPVALGVNGSLWTARLFSLVMVALLTALYTLLPVGGIFLAGIAATTLLLCYEHWLLRHGDLSRLDMAFFTMNGYISIIIFAATLVDVLTGKGGA